ncbi:hypothetical protein KIN20_021740 [Parelaphostrongylus tenuis]|uniref:Uncharacterized protein n=1 Tax=Parelaphostrongylus tenuis TaxID=148309 RepID=A0AAD5N5J2_PARTN|nr:hypothetical protein KIN20_021740 [Parelaphostrongylus tenuis]
MIPHYIIVSSTVTALCGLKLGRMPDCMMPPTLMDIEPIPTNHTSFSGTPMTTNTVMANWSEEMWQRAVNRAVRMLAAGPFTSQFFPAFATVT